MRVTRGGVARLVLAIFIAAVGSLSTPTAEESALCQYCTGSGSVHICSQVWEGEAGWTTCIIFNGGEACGEAGGTCVGGPRED